MSSQNEELLSKPSPLELNKTGLSGATWIIFAGTAVILGTFIGIILVNNDDSRMLVLIAGWLLAGIIGFIGYVAIFNTLMAERLRLAAHMYRSLNLHAYIAARQGNKEALQMLRDVEREESRFVTRALRAAKDNVGEVFAASVVDSIEKTANPPYILVYQNGILDVPSTLALNFTSSMLSSMIALLAFILLGLLMLVIAIILVPILIYTTGKTLQKHIARENSVRRVLGLKETETTEKAPTIAGLVVSILSLGLYLPIYTRKLIKGIDKHIEEHIMADMNALGNANNL